MTIESIIGTDRVLNEFEKLLKREKRCTISLKAPIGRGKSWVATQLVDRMADSNNCCISLFGDSSRNGEVFYPLKQFVEKKDRIRNKTVTVAKELASLIPYIGKEIQLLVKDYDFKRHKKTVQDISPFKNHINFSLHLLSLHRKYSRVIIVCDDFESFDEGTVTFLSELKEGFLQLNEEFNLSFLLISGSEFNVQQYIGFGNIYETELPGLLPNQIKDLVQFWSGKPPSNDQLNLINSCTGGHLSLIKLVASHLKETGEINVGQKAEILWRTVIDSRLRKQRNQYEVLKTLLNVIVKSGKRTTTYEVLCLMGEENDMRELIHQAVQMDLLVVKNNYIHFTHPFIENYIDSLQNQPKASFYEKMSFCVKNLTPSNYSRRAIIEQLAHNVGKADIFWGLATVQKFREGSFEEANVIQNEISTSEYGLEIKEALVQFKVCYDLSFTGEIEETLFEIEQISNSLPKELLGEKNFLKCETLAKKISKSPKEELLSIIAHWEDIKEDEPEIWFRLMQLRIVTASELGLVDLAKKTETEIVKYFSSRLAFDMNARWIIEKLNLFSEIIYNPEVAHKKMLQAEKWLSKEVANEQFHKVIDLFIARTNLSSNCILVNNMEKAVQFALAAVNLAKEFDEVRFPGTEAPLSNYYLALMWADMKNIPSILEGYKEIYEAAYNEENKILIDVNYAGFFVLNNQPDHAMNVLNGGSYIPNLEEDDSYYCYYYWSNYALVCFLLGNVEKARDCFSKLATTAENVSISLKKYYLKHYQIMKEIMDNPNIKSFEEVRMYFQEKHPFFESRVWDRFKFGYLLTDLQIWTFS